MGEEAAGCSPRRFQMRCSASGTFLDWVSLGTLVMIFTTILR